MYPWIVFLHVAGAFGFVLAHGVSVAVLMRLRTERNRQRITTLLDLSSSSMTGFYASVVVLLAAGTLAGFMLNWWRMVWIWASLGLFLAIAVAMYPLATTYFRRVRAAVGKRPSGAPMASDEELDELLSSGRPALIAVIGFGGILVILWMMILKPF
ncbi:MAG: DUF2269 domain-containing protein [Chloroflexota bacterium]|nr:DUF2269 domain-containing protein [Chloroflexota bacterium]